MRTALSRLEREALHRREAERCQAAEGHPFARCFWQPGDYDTPDRYVCGRCFKELRRRQHGTAPPPAPRRPLPVYDRKLHDAVPPPR